MMVFRGRRVNVLRGIAQGHQLLAASWGISAYCILARMAAVPDPRLAVKHVDVIIRNPADPAKSWQGSFLVDASTPDSVAPRPCLEAIGLQPQGRRRYQLADGGELEMDIAVACIECLGAFAGGTVVFAETDTEPILGVTVLASLGVEIDPRTQRLRRMPAVRLKAGWALGIAVADLRESESGRGCSIHEISR